MSCVWGVGVPPPPGPVCCMVLCFILIDSLLGPIKEIEKEEGGSPTHFLINSLLDSIKEIEKSEEELPNTFSY